MIRMWEQNTHYLVDDIVSNDGKVYRCELEHTSQKNFDKFRFAKIRISKDDDMIRPPEITNGSRINIITSMNKKY